MRKDSPARVAHRGAPREYPENTLPSFARALDLGADGIELDVHATRDGVVIVHHDPVPRATSANPRLRGRAIVDLTYQELGQFSVAPGVAIPTLSEVLALVGRSAVVYVELKGANIERPVVDAIRAGPAECAVHSFDHAAIARVASIAPDLRRGLLFSRRLSDPIDAMRAAGAADAWPEWPLIDDAFVEAVHAVGGAVIAWTVNAAGAAHRLAAMGVDAICTDDIRIVPRPAG